MRICRALAGKLAVATIALLMITIGAKDAAAQSFSTIYNFCGQSNCPDGNAPNGWLVQGPDGNLYGTTYTGGAFGDGTVFKITTSGTLTTMHTFSGIDGNEPSALIVASDGNLYGTAQQGGGPSCARGNGLCGNIFRIAPTGAFTVLYNFCSQPNCADGFRPAAALVEGNDGNLYGTTESGGAAGQCQGLGCGTIFRITLSGTFTTLYTFCPGGSCVNAPDGSDPTAPLVQGADGNFYGTTESGGSTNGCPLFGCGTVFRITPVGSLLTLHEFVNSVDGSGPGQIMQALDGNFYGVTPASLFQITPGGTLTTIHFFTYTDGFMPVGLLQATDGTLYGTTAQGGMNTSNCPSGCGTIFQTNYTGAITTLHEFSGSDGATPMGGLVQATEGNFYGTTIRGGNNNNCQLGCGTAFRLSNGLAPFVTIQPESGAFGTSVTILGTNLSGATGVTFNGTPATFTMASPTEIKTTVPTSATTGTVQVTTPSGTLNSSSGFQIIGPLRFVALTPCRAVSTRGNPIPGGTQRNFTLAGTCGIPASAAAYSLNVTVLPHQPLNYLTIWPQGQIRPFVSTMNSPDGRTKANAAIVPAGNNGVSVYVTNTSDVLLDIDGYFVPSVGQSVGFFPLTPCRVVDTRSSGSNFPPGLGPPSLSTMQTRDLPILTSPCLQGLPNQPLAYSFNVTVQPYPAGQYLNYLTIWPSNEPQPVVSTLNNYTATVVANAAIVGDAPNGDVDVFAYNSTDLIIDINGYFATPGGLSYYPASPCRAYDSRTNNGQPFSGERTVNIAGSTCAPPANAQAYVFNATVVPAPTLGYLTLWADGQPQPVVSTLNAYDGFITSNMAIVPNTDGSTDAFAGDGATQLILDINGYFAP